MIAAGNPFLIVVLLIAALGAVMFVYLRLRHKPNVLIALVFLALAVFAYLILTGKQEPELMISPKGNPERIEPSGP